MIELHACPPPSPLRCRHCTQPAACLANYPLLSAHPQTLRIWAPFATQFVQQTAPVAIQQLFQANGLSANERLASTGLTNEDVSRQAGALAELAGNTTLAASCVLWLGSGPLPAEQVAQCRAQLATSVRTLITGGVAQIPWIVALVGAGSGGGGGGFGGQVLPNIISFVQTSAPTIASLVGGVIAG